LGGGAEKIKAPASLSEFILSRDALAYCNSITSISVVDLL